MPVVAIIILNWNDADATICCAASVLAAIQNPDLVHIAVNLYLVDNGSGNKDAAKLQRWCDRQPANQVTLVINRTNLGFSAGMNAGISSAQKSQPDYFFLLNNDLQVDCHTISHLLAFSEANHSKAATGLTVLDPLTGKVQCAGGYRYYPWLGYNIPLMGGASLEQVKAATEHRPDYLSGAAMWLTGDFVRRIGGLPTEHFLYFEELELMQRLKPGEELGVCADAIVTHQGGGSSNTPELQQRATYYATLSAFNYTRRYHPWFLPSVMVARILGISLRAIWRRQPKLISATLHALQDFIFPKGANPP
ncbi:MAG: glycosyltransferase family 2 protein [Halioglobus sp.]